MFHGITDDAAKLSLNVDFHDNEQIRLTELPAASPHRHAPIDGERAPGHPSGLIGGKVQHHRSHFLRLTRPTNRIVGENRIELFRIGHQRSRHRCGNQSRIDHIAPDTVVRVIDGDGASERVQRALNRQLRIWRSGFLLCSIIRILRLEALVLLAAFLLFAVTTFFNMAGWSILLRMERSEQG